MGPPGRLLEEYFDAYLYAANWGTRELAFRLPRALLDAQTARRYCDEGYRAWVTETAEHVIVRFRWDDDEGDGWIEGEGLLDPLLDARGELTAGDLRLLYLGWLLKVQLGGLNEDDDEGLEDEAEPPVPAGLKKPSDSLASVAEFLKIDKDLIEAAAQASGPLVPLSDDGIADWVTALPAQREGQAPHDGRRRRGGAGGGAAGATVPAGVPASGHCGGQCGADSERAAGGRGGPAGRAGGGRGAGAGGSTGATGGRAGRPPASAIWRNWRGIRTRRGSRWRS